MPLTAPRKLMKPFCRYGFVSVITGLQSAFDPSNSQIPTPVSIWRHFVVESDGMARLKPAITSRRASARSGKLASGPNCSNRIHQGTSFVREICRLCGHLDCPSTLVSSPGLVPTRDHSDNHANPVDASWDIRNLLES